MNSLHFKGSALGGIATVALMIAAVGGCKDQPKVAEVVAVKEITETIRTPREECRDVQVQ